MGQISARGKTAPASEQMARKGFAGYRSGERSRTETAVVKEDPVLQRLTEAFRFQLNEKKDKVWSILEEIEISSDDITRFSIALEQFQHEPGFSDKSGFFLNTLMRRCTEADITIRTDHLTEQVDNLGWENTKNITVIGDVGHNLGAGMKGGSIKVSGNAGDFVGESMQDGSIIIDKDVRQNPGRSLKGGSILVGGNALFGAGGGMKSGNIIIQGNIHGHIGGRDIGTDLMDGGTVMVYGNAYNTGMALRGGEVFIEGDLQLAQGEAGRILSSGGKVYHRGELMAEDGLGCHAYDAMYSDADSEENGYFSPGRYFSDSAAENFGRGVRHTGGEPWEWEYADDLDDD